MLFLARLSIKDGGFAVRVRGSKSEWIFKIWQWVLKIVLTLSTEKLGLHSSHPCIKSRIKYTIHILIFSKKKRNLKRDLDYLTSWFLEKRFLHDKSTKLRTYLSIRHQNTGWTKNVHTSLCCAYSVCINSGFEIPVVLYLFWMLANA